MQTTPIASAECYVTWQAGDSSHTLWRYFPKLDFWRDFMPGDLSERMQDQDGQVCEVEVPGGNGLPNNDPSDRRELAYRPVEEAFHRLRLHGPYLGRFYPRGVLARINGAGTLCGEDMHPVRVTRVDSERVGVDLGHPLGGVALKVGGRIVEHLKSKEERGGSCNDLLVDMSDNGPGMQCPPPGGRVDFDQPDNFTRADPAPDELFYTHPRMVHHIDSQARQFVNAVYRRFIKPGDQVLDLMSSWVSHLDSIPESAQLSGLGMNAQELEANLQLKCFVVHDLNQDPRLPWADASFDTVVCTVSVEYLTEPYRVFAEVARVLRPGGHFVVTFSDRWFPPKAIQLWSRLHPFERMGLVLDYFSRSGSFTQLGTESRVFWPRPEDDQYYGRLFSSDPVFAVWGQRTQ